MTREDIHNEIDYMVAIAELETGAARKVVENARSENDYYKEKAAAKMLAFFEHDEQSLRIYAELKLYHPELAEIVETERPHLHYAYSEAVKGYAVFREKRAQEVASAHP